MNLFKILLSVANTNNPKSVLDHLKNIEDLLELNEVDKLIIKDIKTGAELNKVPSPEFLEQKYSYASPTDDLVLEYIKPKAINSAILELTTKQGQQKLSKDLIGLGGGVTKLTPKELRAEINKVLESSFLKTNLEAPTNDLVPLDNAYKSLSGLTGTIKLFHPQIEQYTRKPIPGTIISYLAFAGSFKTVAACNTAYLNALDGKNVLYIALESTSQDIINRLVVNHIAVTAKNTDELIKNTWISDNKLTESQKDLYNSKYTDLLNKLNNHLIVWDETKVSYDTFIEMTETLRTADDLFKKTTGSGLDIIILDQLALLKYTQASGRKYGYDGAVLNDWVSYFRKQTLDFLETDRQITLVLVSQINRDSYNEASKPKNKGRYDMTCASDASEIERASDAMITLYKDLDTQNTLLINVPKARRGTNPDNPIQLDVFGEYYHIGYLNMLSSGLSASDFEAESFDLDSLLG